MKSLYVRCMDALHRCCMVIAGICLVVITLIIPWGVFTRYVLNSAASWPEPAAVLLMIWFSFMAAALCYRENLHIGVAVFPMMLRGKPRLAVGWLIEACMMGTGHDVEGPTRGRLSPDEETVVVLMGLDSAGAVLQGLIEEGRSPDTPAVAVQGASRAEERVVAGTLATLAEAVRAAGLESPVTLIVGEAARGAQDQTSSEVAGTTLGAAEVA